MFHNRPHFRDKVNKRCIDERPDILFEELEQSSEIISIKWLISSQKRYWAAVEQETTAMNTGLPCRLTSRVGKMWQERKCPISHTKMPSASSWHVTCAELLTQTETRHAARAGQNVLTSTTRGSEITGRTVTFFTCLARSQKIFEQQKNEHDESTWHVKSQTINIRRCDQTEVWLACFSPN